MFSRKRGDDEWILDCNITHDEKKAYTPHAAFELVYSTEDADGATLFPYEARIWHTNTKAGR